ncbi:MAG: hypothetical protein UW91_C0029G0005 [Parcubacteria group bacterium GW2011_GWF2_45_11]|nr:MAG: hypothetical protein UW91_C0029G0005 [Parcubacteria group bacterium GW2011_GWF2_45_11]OGW69897.1 MAG: hypothetical protein A2036_02900 [Omnitrophica bacterium GWA2_50_21]
MTTATYKKLNLKAMEGVRTILFQLGDLKKGETCCIVSDTNTANLGNAFFEAASAKKMIAGHFVIPPFKIHGEEPPDYVASRMADADLVIGLTNYSMAHSLARHRACQNGARYLSLPDYSEKVLAHPSLRVDYKKSAKKARRLVGQLTKGKTVRIKTKAGTDIQLQIQGRTGNYCPGYVKTGLQLGSPPDIEINIAPLEDGSEGKVVIDGSIPAPGLGKLRSPVTLTVKNGIITKFGGDPEYCKILEKLFAAHGDKGRVLAEFGIGLNPKAKLCGNMLIDEGCYGTFHFGFGSNATIGGKNSVKIHIDFVFYANSFELDGKNYKI